MIPSRSTCVWLPFSASGTTDVDFGAIGEYGEQRFAQNHCNFHRLAVKAKSLTTRQCLPLLGSALHLLAASKYRVFFRSRVPRTNAANHHLGEKEQQKRSLSSPFSHALSYFFLCRAVVLPGFSLFFSCDPYILLAGYSQSIGFAQNLVRRTIAPHCSCIDRGRSGDNHPPITDSGISNW